MFVFRAVLHINVTFKSANMPQVYRVTSITTAFGSGSQVKQVALRTRWELTFQVRNRFVCVLAVPDGSKSDLGN